MNHNQAYLIAWISSDYFESLLLPGENDTKQTDEFQASLFDYLKQGAPYSSIKCVAGKCDLKISFKPQPVNLQLTRLGIAL